MSESIIISKEELLKKIDDLETQRDQLVEQANAQIKQFTAQANQQVNLLNGRIAQLQSLLDDSKKSEEEE